MLESATYIAIEGPIGVGKSSFARMLAEDLGATAFLENPDQNPFLGPFYEEPSRYAFQTQLHFLMSRHEQQAQISKRQASQSPVVSDYVFAKDYIFAHLNLTDDEYDLYQRVYGMVERHAAIPDVVVYLQSQPEVLLKRLRQRKKAYEASVDLDYLRRVSEAYSQYFFEYNQTPLLVVNSSGLDFVKHREDYEMLKKEIFYLLKSGTRKHFVTISPH